MPSGFRSIYVDVAFLHVLLEARLCTVCKRHALPLKKNSVNVRT